MTRDRLIRILLRLAIVFVGLQIAAVVFTVALFAYLWCGGDMPMPGGSDLWSDTEFPR